MRQTIEFIRFTFVWILAIPYVLIGLGTASNQAVLIANHDKFPVLTNSRIFADKADADGMLDDTHCIMTNDSRLKPLADIFDVETKIMSIGDIAIETGEWSGTILPSMWLVLFLAINGVRKRKNEFV